MLNINQVADYFLMQAEPEVGDVITNLKLQKLVYYAQGFCLAMHGEKLFNDDILAWEHGPVVEKLYHTYKQLGAEPIPQPDNFDVSIYSKEQLELLKEVNDVFGQFSAWKLRNMTHSERPWLETPKNNVIAPELMAEYFKTQLI